MKLYIISIILEDCTNLTHTVDSLVTVYTLDVVMSIFTFGREMKASWDQIIYDAICKEDRYIK